ncbi:MAG: hypothetical protein ABW223_11375 [Rariglobus sp.]
MALFLAEMKLPHVLKITTVLLGFGCIAAMAESFHPAVDGSL